MVRLIGRVCNVDILQTKHVTTCFNADFLHFPRLGKVYATWSYSLKLRQDQWMYSNCGHAVVHFKLLNWYTKTFNAISLYFSRHFSRNKSLSTCKGVLEVKSKIIQVCLNQFSTSTDIIAFQYTIYYFFKLLHYFVKRIEKWNYLWFILLINRISFLNV